jgi:hypothetical protein
MQCLERLEKASQPVRHRHVMYTVLAAFVVLYYGPCEEICMMNSV